MSDKFLLKVKIVRMSKELMKRNIIYYIILYYISVTEDPEHLIPSQESPHGSPPLDFQPLSFEGEFKLVYITLRAETAKLSTRMRTMQCNESQSFWIPSWEAVLQ